MCHSDTVVIQNLPELRYLHIQLHTGIILANTMENKNVHFDTQSQVTYVLYGEWSL